MTKQLTGKQKNHPSIKPFRQNRTGFHRYTIAQPSETNCLNTFSAF